MSLGKEGRVNHLTCPLCLPSPETLHLRWGWYVYRRKCSSKSVASANCNQKNVSHTVSNCIVNVCPYQCTRGCCGHKEISKALSCGHRLHHFPFITLSKWLPGPDFYFLFLLLLSTRKRSRLVKPSHWKTGWLYQDDKALTAFIVLKGTGTVGRVL